MDELRPIVLIDDDPEDIELLVEAYRTLSYKNELLIFHDSTKAYQYLTESGIVPCLIISDMLMPKITGLELYEKLRAFPGFVEHYIPFVFFSGAPVPPPTVIGNDLIRHYYFEKQCEFKELQLLLNNIIRHHSSMLLQ
ncbi:response regulator [Flavobacterium rakeshii]|uniref:response regulator n=1 Tax=Flavobacterium rakeshii TaxID=1038845 RepID=UPI002E7B7EBD|nr:response regulator [Flavobacterium rakeshii]MEE1896986.1 response regulator [Flavobacterium rakeshii]